MALLVDAGIIPSNSGIWETHSDIYGKGGFRSVADTTARDAITTARRTFGMWVWVTSTSTLYKLGSGLTNADWTVVSFSGAGGDIKSDGTVAFAANQSMGGFKITNLGTPTATTDAVTKAYADSATIDDGSTTQKTGATLAVRAAGIGTSSLASSGVTFAKIQNVATDSLIGRDTTGTGVPENILLDAATLQMDGSLNLRVPSQLGARGSENVVIDLYPSTQQQGALNTGSSINIDVAIATGRRYTITADVYVDDGAGGACLYTKALSIKAHQTGGAAVKLSDVTLAAPLEGAGFTFVAAANSTNIRFTIANTSGTNRTYNLAIGYWVMDKP